MDEQQQLYLIYLVFGIAMLILLILIIGLFVKLASLSKELKLAQAQAFRPQQQQQFQQGPAHAQMQSNAQRPQSLGYARRNENDELARRGYSVYSPSSPGQGQGQRPGQGQLQQRYDDPRQQSAPREPPAPPPKKGGFFSKFGSKVVQSDAFGAVASGQIDVGGAVGNLGGFVENDALAGVMESQLFQAGVSAAVEYGANKAIERNSRQQQGGGYGGYY